MAASAVRSHRRLSEVLATVSLAAEPKAGPSGLCWHGRRQGRDHSSGNGLARSLVHRRMTRMRLAGCWFIAGLCGGCGGQAQEDAQVVKDAGTQRAGFYSVMFETMADSCDPAQSPDTLEQLVSSNDQVFNIPITQIGGGRQDLPWDRPFNYTLSECGTSIAIEVQAKNLHSFTVNSQIDWVNPSACRASLPYRPKSDCLVHQRETYELEQACPATRKSGPGFVSCN